MALESYKFVCLCVLGQKVNDVETCSLAGSIANIVWSIALKARIQGLLQSQGWRRCVHKELKCVIPFLLIQ